MIEKLKPKPDLHPWIAVIVLLGFAPAASDMPFWFWLWVALVSFPGVGHTVWIVVKSIVLYGESHFGGTH